MSDTLVLCYHAVSERWQADLSVTPESLERQLTYLVRRGYRGRTFLQAMTEPPAAKTLAVTFDDSYRSVFELALPILADLRLPATVFVPTEFAERERPMTWPGNDQWIDGPDEDETVCMSWQQLGHLAEAGWEIGSHTRTHPHLPDLDDRSLESELRNSREECEQQLTVACLSLAYPYGDLDFRVLEAARTAGYAAGAALPDRIFLSRRLAWPRIGIYHGDTERRFRAKVGRGSRRLRASPAWAAVTRSRRATLPYPRS